MLLSDTDIVFALQDGSLSVEPAGLIQPASMDIQLGRELRTYHRDTRPIDPMMPPVFGTHEVPLNQDGIWVLDPGQFVLANTVQYIKLSKTIQATLSGKSTLGRLGLVVHATAGFIDPGFEGEITLELTNVNCCPIILRPGMWIAQLSFMRVQHVSRPYGHPDRDSHYQGQTGATVPHPLVSSH